MGYVELLVPELEKMELDEFAIDDATDPYASEGLREDAKKYLASYIRREDSRFDEATKEERLRVIELYLEEYY